MKQGIPGALPKFSPTVLAEIDGRKDLDGKTSRVFASFAVLKIPVLVALGSFGGIPGGGAGRRLMRGWASAVRPVEGVARKERPPAEQLETSV